MDTLSRGHFGTKRPEAAGSVPTPEYAAIVGAPAKPHGFVGRGGAAERVSFAACGETSDTQLATTRQETFSGRTAMESKMEGTHIPTRLFKQAVSLSRQARAIEATLDGINPLNAGKKKEEALSMLKKWFPQMENFSGQLKKYKVTINDLLAENEKLEARAKASEKGKMKDTMERAKLKSELDNLQRLVDRIPPDILAELKRQQRQYGKER